MKSPQLWKFFGPAIILIFILVLIPAGTTWANSDFQSIPTLKPATNTPAITPIPATNTPNPGTNPGNTAVPSDTPNSIIPSIIATSTITGTLPVTLSPVSPTETVSGFGTATETITTTPIVTDISLTPVPGVQLSPTPSTGASAQSQNTTDYALVYYGLAALVVILIVFLWLRSRRKSGKF